MEVIFTKDKETKNTFRFTATGGDVAGSLYVNKESELANQETLVLEIPESAEVSA